MFFCKWNIYWYISFCLLTDTVFNDFKQIFDVQVEDLTFDLKHLYAEVRESALVPGILLPRGGVSEKKNRSIREPMLGFLYFEMIK